MPRNCDFADDSQKFEKFSDRKTSHLQISQNGLESHGKFFLRRRKNRTSLKPLPQKKDLTLNLPSTKTLPATGSTLSISANSRLSTPRSMQVCNHPRLEGCFARACRFC